MFDQATRHKLNSCSRIRSGMPEKEKQAVSETDNSELKKMINQLKNEQPDMFLMTNEDLRNRMFFDEPASNLECKSFIRPYQPMLES